MTNIIHLFPSEWILGREASAVRELDMLAAGVARLHDYYSLNVTALTQESILISQLNPQPIPITIPVSGMMLHLFITHISLTD